MTYELLKELKDAGFPQRTCSFLDCRHGMDKGIECVYKPNLSELIEACMDRVGNFHLKNKKTTRADAWFAGKSIEYVGQFVGNGATPEEAVARLWLALNKN